MMYTTSNKSNITAPGFSTCDMMCVCVCHKFKKMIIWLYKLEWQINVPFEEEVKVFRILSNVVLKKKLTGVKDFPELFRKVGL